MKLLPLIPILAVAIAARAQDAVQRAFPLEAARVLAEQRGIVGEVTVSPGDASTTKVTWRDTAGKTVRERTIATSAQGATYYREVFRQLAGDDWLPPSAPPDNAPSAFWQGADLAGANRTEALATIARLLAEKPRNERAADAARLAGAFVQAAAPSPAEMNSPDLVLLARGVAWLARAETCLREPIDAAWAPVLFLAGHKDEAAGIWKSSAPKKQRSSAEKSWDLALGGPRPAGPVAKAAPVPDFTDSDKAWAYLRGLDQPPRDADSPEDQKRRLRLWLTQRRGLAEKFQSSFPSDPRRWDAAIIAYEAAQNLTRFGERDVKLPPADMLDAILAAPDASAEAKGDAAFFRAMRAGDDVAPSAPHTLPPFHRALSEFIANYPQHPRAPTAVAIQLQLLDAIETPGADKMLAALAAHANPQIAMQAKARLEQRARFTELKKTPLELKFTADDGREVDATKLRGKVVLLDFWASWCGPCMSDAPHVAATYSKLRERGFEIVGVNLDSDKAAMETAAKGAGMTWPQHFDGKAWESELAQRFGIRSIPATWLFDKQGKLREIGLRGEELEARIENLLREK